MVKGIDGVVQQSSIVVLHEVFVVVKFLYFMQQLEAFVWRSVMNVGVVQVLIAYHPEFMNTVEDRGSDKFEKRKRLLLLGGIVITYQELMLYVYPVLVKQSEVKGVGA